VIWAGLLGLVATAEALRLWSSPDVLGWALKVGLPASGSLVSLLCLRLPRAAQQNTIIMVSSAGVALVVADACVALFLPPRQSVQEALRQEWQRAGLPVDGRSVMDVVRDLRRQGIAAYPKLNPAAHLVSSTGDVRADITIGGVEVVPMGTIPSALSVYCNETGSYVTYTSDEHGFNNPPGIWTTPGLDIAFIGDSYTEGACVPPEANMVARVREKVPATVNLGMAGNGPLIELASLSEYLPARRPRVVVWEYTEGNDLVDLLKERRSPILRRYLEDGFTQGLGARRNALAAALTAYVDSRIDVVARPPSGGMRRIPRSVADVLLLAHLRGHVRPVLQLEAREAARADNLRLFRTIAQKLKERVRSWGGALVFVYLPSPSRYDRLSRPWTVSPSLLSTRDDVLAIINELEIPSLDLDPVLRRGVPSYYVHGIGHLSTDGYRAAGDAILEFLHSGKLGRFP
jgi:hypothetical protein